MQHTTSQRPAALLRGEGYKRLVSAIGDEVKDLAGDTVAERIEAGAAFSDADLAKMKETRIK